MILKGVKPVLYSVVVWKKEQKSFEIITVKEAAQRLRVRVQSIEYLLSNDNGEGTSLDHTYPFSHDGDSSGPKFIVCNDKFMALEMVKKSVKQ